MRAAQPAGSGATCSAVRPAQPSPMAETRKPSRPRERISTWLLPLHGQADIILGERLRGSFRARHIIELGELAALVEFIVLGKAVQQRRHPPGEALHLP